MMDPQPNRVVKVGKIHIGNHLPLTLIAGPCVLEGTGYAQGVEFALRTAEALKKIAEKTGFSLIYKASFDKANRTSLTSFRGPGLDAGLKILDRVRSELDLPVVTDVHDISQARVAGHAVDMLQTPAFLCRQTDFIQAVAMSGVPVNIKKGQFLAPEEMTQVARKARDAGNEDILLCERGYAFGYHNLVVDMRSLAIMAQTGYPVVFDATHSVQHPGGIGHASSGERRFVEPLARAAVAVGLAGIFMETHPDPDQAPCDGANMVPFAALPSLLSLLQRLDAVVKS